jgi:hypothetical protein
MKEMAILTLKIEHEDTNAYDDVEMIVNIADNATLGKHLRIFKLFLQAQTFHVHDIVHIDENGHHRLSSNSTE